MVRIFFPSKQSYKPLQELYPRYYQIGPYSCSWAGAPAHWALYGPFDPLVHFTGPVGIHVTAPRDRHDSYHSIPSAAARRPHGITQKAKQQRDQWWSRGRAGEAVEGEKKKKTAAAARRRDPKPPSPSGHARPAGRQPTYQRDTATPAVRTSKQAGCRNLGRGPRSRRGRDETSP